MKHNRNSFLAACALVTGVMFAISGPLAAQDGVNQGSPAFQAGVDPGPPALLNPDYTHSSLAITAGSDANKENWILNPYFAHKVADPLLPNADGTFSLAHPERGPLSEYAFGLNLTTLSNQNPWNINGKISYQTSSDRSIGNDRVAENVFRHVSSTLAAGYAFHDWEPYLALTLDKKMATEESVPFSLAPSSGNLALGARFDISHALTGEVTTRSFLMQNQIEERNILGNIRMSF
ncbi:MAG: hypothetical protein H7833_18385 [Magnetococcus sp. DMHC-1]|nr:hypothetical protein [Magnetococcales bacterium]